MEISDAEVPPSAAPATPQLLLPVGTQIVTRVETRLGRDRTGTRPPGAVGVITQAPADARHAYRVRFAAGEEVSLRRTELAVLKRFQLPGGEALPGETIGDAAAGEELETYRPSVIYRCVVGSRAYGLAQEGSDIDRRGIYLPPAEVHWSLYGVPEQVADARSDEVYWELQKFLVLALKANPNVLECLYTPLVEEATPLAEELRALRATFLSRLIYQSYGGYVFSQFRKLEADIRAAGAIRWKHAMHLVRLLLAGIVALREGYVPVEVREHREELLAIRRQQVAWAEVDAWRLALHQEFDAAYAATQLPERPDYARANAFLVQARRSRV